MHANVRLGITVSAAILSAVSTVHAQLTVKTDWAAINNTLTNIGNTAGTPGFTTYAGNKSVGQAKLTITATHTGGTNLSSREQRVTMTQLFNLSGSSIVQVPRYYNGDINFFGGAGNLSNSRNDATWTITNLDTNTVAATWSETSGLRQASNNFSANSAILATTPALVAGDYKIDVILSSFGYTRPVPSDSPPAGTGVTADWNSGLKGAGTNIEAWPSTIWDTRSVVGAPQARANYGVNGTGVEVGLIEVGRPYRDGTGGADTGDWSGAHPSMAGRLFVPASIYAEEIKTKYRNEHAQAVASIIGANNLNNANAGIAPGAFLTTYATSADPAGGVNDYSPKFRNGLDSLVTLGMRVINMSMTSNDIDNGLDPAEDYKYLDQKLNAFPNVVFVKSSGNNGDLATNGVTAPGSAYNIISAGGIGTNNRRIFYSSFGNATLNPFKPDIVAPAQFVNSAAAFDGGFTRGFTGEAFDVNKSVTGSISGTSFAAPHVTGTVALLEHYYDQHQADHDANAKVMRAVLLNSATTGNVYRTNGSAWAQTTTNDPGDGHLIVQRSLDPELGAGLLNSNQALKQYANGEVRIADGNTDPNFKINVGNQPFWWDHEQVATNSDVDYLLTPGLSFLRATMTWNAKDNQEVADMSLALYYEGNTNGNVDGYDPTNPNDDVMIAETLTTFGGLDQNVALINMSVPEAPFVELFDLLNFNYGRFYLAAFNQSGDNVDYGIAVSYIPEPGLLGLSLVLIPLLKRRRAA